MKAPAPSRADIGIPGRKRRLPVVTLEVGQWLLTAFGVVMWVPVALGALIRARK